MIQKNANMTKIVANKFAYELFKIKKKLTVNFNKIKQFFSKIYINL